MSGWGWSTRSLLKLIVLLLAAQVADRSMTTLLAVQRPSLPLLGAQARRLAPPKPWQQEGLIRAASSSQGVSTASSLSIDVGRGRRAVVDRCRHAGDLRSAVVCR